jgi:hypothetical protein
MESSWLLLDHAGGVVKNWREGPETTIRGYPTCTAETFLTGGETITFCALLHEE